MRVPRRDLLSGLDRRAILNQKLGTHLERVGIEARTLLRPYLHRAVLVEHDFAALVVAHLPHVDELDDAGVLEDDLGDLCGRGRRAADVERTHRKLGAGFADGLGGDDAHRRADLDLAARGQVAPVALRAHSVLGVAGESGADPHLLDARLGDRGARRLVYDLVRLDNHVLAGIRDVVERGAAEDALGERHLDLVALDDRLDLDAVDRVAVLDRDDHILRHVYELARKVARVGGLERRIRETLAGAVGRNEVFEHRKPFTEGRGNRALDDVAGRIGHEAAHAGELTDLEL